MGWGVVRRYQNPAKDYPSIAFKGITLSYFLAKDSILSIAGTARTNLIVKKQQITFLSINVKRTSSLLERNLLMGAHAACAQLALRSHNASQRRDGFFVVRGHQH